MLPKEILSLQHPIVKHLVKLRKERSYRREKNSALIVGFTLVDEISEHLPLDILIIEKDVPVPFSMHAKEIYSVSKSILKKITAVESPEPFAAVVSLPKPANLNGKKKILALDGISDPGNLGTLLRTALALGWEEVFLLPGTADPFNEKAIRAAKGATFHLPIQEGSAEELDALISKNQMHVYAADCKGTSVEKEKISYPALLILGNESQGIKVRLQAPTHAICIPIQDMESLNVAIAGAILMYQLKGDR